MYEKSQSLLLLNAVIVATEAIQLVYFGFTLFSNVLLKGHLLVKVDEEKEDEDKEEEEEEKTRKKLKKIVRNVKERKRIQPKLKEQL